MLQVLQNKVDSKGETAMPQVTSKSLATAIAALLVSVVLMPSPAHAKLTKAEKAAWKQANVSCKAEGKGKKLGWMKRRKFVKGCIVESLKGYPNINVEKIMKEMDTRKLPVSPGGQAI
jgi:hypothetical protein